MGKVSKYGVSSGPYFPVLSPNIGKYGPEKTPYLDTFHAISVAKTITKLKDQRNASHWIPRFRTNNKIAVLIT